MKNIFRAILLICSITVLADVKIQIKSNPALPLKNQIKNSNFADGLKHWKIMQGTQANVSNGILVIKGDNKVKSGVYQEIRFNEPVSAGGKISISVETSSKDTDNELKRPAIIIYGMYKDGTNSYLPGPPLPPEQHEWVKSSKTVTVKKDILGFNLYIAYYNQAGSISVRSVTAKSVKGQIEIQADGKFKNVKVYNSTEGLIDNTNSSAYDKKFPIIPDSAYYVEVLAEDGSVYTKRYPENAFAPKTTGENAVSVFSRFDTAAIMPGTKESFSFNIPELKKEVVLSFDARLASKLTKKVSGYTNALKLTLNGEKITPSMLVERTKTFTRMDGVIANIYGSAFVVFYSPWSYTLGECNSYCPVNEINRNPFLYKFDVGKLIKKGRNILEIHNSVVKRNPPSKLYITNAQILMK